MPENSKENDFDERCGRNFIWQVVKCNLKVNITCTSFNNITNNVSYGRTSAESSLHDKITLLKNVRTCNLY